MNNIYIQGLKLTGWSGAWTEKQNYGTVSNNSLRNKQIHLGIQDFKLKLDGRGPSLKKTEPVSNNSVGIN